MGVKDFLSSSQRLLKLITRPDLKEMWLSIRICLFGIGLVGVIGFIIRFISTLLQGFVPTV